MTKALILLAGVLLASVSISGVAQAGNGGVCDPTWSKCLVFGSYVADGSAADGTPVATELNDSTAAAQGQIPSLSLFSDTLEVQLQGTQVIIVPKAGEPGSPMTIGTVSAPVGDDAKTAFAREFKLADGVLYSTNSTQQSRKTCDPGGTFGPMWYFQKVAVTELTFAGSGASIVFPDAAEQVVSSHGLPAILGCPKKTP